MSATIAQAADVARERSEAVNRRQYERAESLCRQLDGVTIGYIGNVYLDGTDDRSWFIFLPHPGRVGESSDRLGGYSTAERGRLLPLIAALKIGFDLCKSNPGHRVEFPIAENGRVVGSLVIPFRSV